MTSTLPPAGGPRARRLFLAMATVALAALALLLGARPAAAADPQPCAAPFGHPAFGAVQRCPLWMPPRGSVPVHHVAGGLREVGRLVQAGSANWFVCQDDSPDGVVPAEYRDPGARQYVNRWWARTLSDQNTWGWVNEVYFSGGANHEPDAGLRRCDGGAAPPPSPPPGSEPAPPPPARPFYAALGDSYASGLGAGDYISGTGSCWRSWKAYAFLLEKGPEFRACAGARTPDVLEDQLGRFRQPPTLVTLSIGGNDAGFADVARQCAKPWPTTCWGDIREAKRFIEDDLRGRLDPVYDRIRSRAPRARVIVVGYPRIFSGNDECNFLGRVSPEEQRRLNEVGDSLAAAIRQEVAGRRNFVFADARAAFEGHGVCSEDEWIRGVSKPVEQSYHPNEKGHQAYAALIRRLR